MNHTDYILNNGRTLRIYTNCDQQYVDNNLISPEEGIGHCVMCFPREEILTNTLDYKFLYGDEKYGNFIYTAFYTGPQYYQDYIAWMITEYHESPVAWKKFENNISKSEV